MSAQTSTLQAPHQTHVNTPRTAHAYEDGANVALCGAKPQNKRYASTGAQHCILCQTIAGHGRTWISR